MALTPEQREYQRVYYRQWTQQGRRRKVLTPEQQARHRDYNRQWMRDKRALDPDYRQRERAAEHKRYQDKQFWQVKKVAEHLGISRAEARRLIAHYETRGN